MIEVPKPPFCQTDVTSSACSNVDLFGNHIIDKTLVARYVNEPEGLLMVRWHVRVAQINRKTARFLLSKRIGIDAGQRFDQ